MACKVRESAGKLATILFLKYFQGGGEHRGDQGRRQKRDEDRAQSDKRDGDG